MINPNYWYHLTNHFAGEKKVLTVQNREVIMAPLSQRGQDPLQLWKFEPLPQFGAGWYRIRNKGLGSTFSLGCSQTTATIGPTGAYGGQEWHITDLLFGPDWHRLTNHFITEAKSLDSSKTAPTVGLKGAFGGQEWRFTAMMPVENLPKPPKELNQFYDKYVTTQGIHILGTAAVSGWAMLQVQHVFENMVLSLKNQTDRNKFKGQIIIVLNAADMPSTPPGYPYSEKFNSPGEIADLNSYRGGGTGDGKYIFVTEEMICRVGVESRKDNDTLYREFDQVVHEWGHTVEAFLSLHSKTDQIFTGQTWPREQFAWTTEKWFNNHFAELKTRSVTRDDLKQKNKVVYDYFSEVFDASLPFYPSTLYHKLLV